MRLRNEQRISLKHVLVNHFTLPIFQWFAMAISNKQQQPSGCFLMLDMCSESVGNVFCWSVVDPIPLIVDHSVHSEKHHVRANEVFVCSKLLLLHALYVCVWGTLQSSYGRWILYGLSLKLLFMTYLRYAAILPYSSCNLMASSFMKSSTTLLELDLVILFAIWNVSDTLITLSVKILHTRRSQCNNLIMFCLISWFCLKAYKHLYGLFNPEI